MKKSNIKYLTLTLLALLWSLAPVKAGDPEGDQFEPSTMILHHISDAHEWHILDYKGADGQMHPLSIPLPVIVLTGATSDKFYTDGTLDVFMSGEFQHGTATVSKGDRNYKIEHEHIVEASGKSVIDFSITKNVASMFLAATILLSIFTAAAGGYKKRPGQAPKGLQGVIEPLIVFVRDDIAIPNIGEAKYRKYLPYLLTVFFFIWINNMLGLIPTGANASGNIAFTFTLAVITALITNFSGNKSYWAHIFWTPGVPLPLRLIMLPVELIGILTKPFALMIRLFANITAGHIIILSLLSFIFIFKSFLVGAAAGSFVIIMTFMELFVAALQAYIFTLLSALFIGTAVEEHDHGHEHAHDHH